MLLKSFTVRDFQSIHDSNAVEVGDITCLVGKNEAGKTALLRALYRLHPISPGDGTFDLTDDYPRASVTEYERDLKGGTRASAIVTRAVFALEADELRPIEARFGTGVLPSRELTLTRGYDNTTRFELAVNERIAGEALLGRGLGASGETVLEGDWHTLSELASLLESRSESAGAGSFDRIPTPSSGFGEGGEQRATAVAEATEVSVGDPSRATEVRSIAREGLAAHIWETYLASGVPRFLYFDDYYQIRGCENIEALQQRMAEDRLLPSDHPLIGLLELAGLDLTELVSPSRTQDLKNKLQGASNYLTRQILKYWSQNKHLRLAFDVRPAQSGDPEGMRSGTNIWAEVVDQKHFVSTPLGARSRGFVWFFSFLAWYSRLRTSEHQRVILLLDEPGLSLHARAQRDLLCYFEQELRGGHQLLYSTHSPFMVDPTHLERVRIVQDRTVDADEALPPGEEGTKVVADLTDAEPDSLFPLQSALGYDLARDLFPSRDHLVVEGVSDLLFLQTMSAVLAANGRTELSPRWAVTPVGGADRVGAFVALAGVDVATRSTAWIDLRGDDSGALMSDEGRQLLARNRVLTFAQFTGRAESAIEDMFEADFYLDLVNKEYAKQLSQPLKLGDLNQERPRIVDAVAEYFDAHPLRGGAFSRYRPARYFAERNTGTFPLKFPAATLDRFEQAFVALNGMLD